MGQIVVNVGSFDLTSHNGNTAYSSVRYFDIPANAGITGCVATFATHANTGNFQGKSFSLNGAQAHPNTPWPTSGIALNPALLSTGQNTFRAAVKSQAGLSARWSIGDIYLTIDYNDVGGGGGTTDPGTISISKTSLTAGESLTVSVTGASGGVYRDVYIQKMPSTANILFVAQGHGSGAGSWEVTIPESWCETLSPDDPSFEVRIYMVSYIAGGTVVGDGAKMLTVNVPASAVPTIGAFTATRDANGVDASITKYVQNYSKVNLAMGSVAGALGSSIASYEITGAGFSAAASSATMGPFGQTGDITFTAKVTDTRGRTVTRAVTINVLSYGPPAFSNPEAWRSSDTGTKNQKGTYCRLKSGVVYSSLDGQNSVTLKGMVHIKGGTVPAYTSMTPDTAWITGGGLLLVTKTYIAQMLVEDLISARIVEFTIPTKKTGISIMAGMRGAAVGKVAETPGMFESAWPIYVGDKGVAVQISYSLLSLDATGWNRIGIFDDQTASGGPGSLLLSMTNNYFTANPSPHLVSVTCGYNKSNIQKLSGLTTIQSFQKIRTIALTSTSFAIEVYFNTGSGGGNQCRYVALVLSPGGTYTPATAPTVGSGTANAELVF